MKIKRYGSEIEVLRTEYVLLDKALDSDGELCDDVLERALFMGGGAIRLLEQSEEEEALALVREAQDILEQAARLTRPFTAEIKKGMIRVAIDNIVAALDLLEGIDDTQEAAEATGATEDATYDTEDATYDTEEVNPYKELCENLMDAAELLRASGALLPEFVAMKEAGLQKARLMVAIALAELCE